MPSNRTYYVICDDNCKFEGMTKEQILSAIVQAVEGGEIHDVNTGFVTTIKEQNANAGLKVWVGTQAQYNAIEEKDDNTLYIITDETDLADMLSRIAALEASAEAATPIDVSDAITMTTFEGADVEIESKRFVFSPAAGVVHFSVFADLSNITADNVSLIIGGNYLPSEAAAVMMDKSGYAGKIANGYILIHLPSRTATSLLVSGWYFCDGE